MGNSIARFTVIQPGLFSTIQDKGRFGLRSLGIPWAGTLCPAWQEIANALVGNDVNAPVIETFEGGLQIQATDHDILLAIVGCNGAVIRIVRSGKSTTVRPNRAVTLHAGETLLLSSTGNARHALIAAAGIAIPTHLGSASTYAKANLGGIDGTNLAAGQTIDVMHQTQFTRSTPFTELQCQLPQPLLYQDKHLRVIAGPQADNFSRNGVDTFLGSDYQLGVETDRMGVRLNGPVIEHRNVSSRDIVSDAIVPGSIQVPGTGLPIVLLNDAHTAGGYPKIATVVSCDLPLLAIQRTGAIFRFKLIDINDAIAASTNLVKVIEKTIDSFTPCIRRELDSESLLQTNLIDGVTDGT